MRKQTWFTERYWLWKKSDLLKTVDRENKPDLLKANDLEKLHDLLNLYDSGKSNELLNLVVSLKYLDFEIYFQLILTVVVSAVIINSLYLHSWIKLSWKFVSILKFVEYSPKFNWILENFQYPRP